MDGREWNWYLLSALVSILCQGVRKLWWGHQSNTPLHAMCGSFKLWWVNRKWGREADARCNLLVAFAHTRYGDATTSIHTVSENPGVISLQPFNQLLERTLLRRLNLDSPERYLGLHITMNGTWSYEFQLRKEQIKKLLCRVSESEMTRHDAYMIYLARYKPSLVYPLHHTTLTHSQCNSRIPNVIHPFPM